MVTYDRKNLVTNTNDTITSDHLYIRRRLAKSKFKSFMDVIILAARIVIFTSIISLLNKTADVFFL